MMDYNNMIARHRHAFNACFDRDGRISQTGHMKSYLFPYRWSETDMRKLSNGVVKSPHVKAKFYKEATLPSLDTIII